MGLEEFRDKVRREFGEDLHRASPATVRDFLDRLDMDSYLAALPHDRRIEIEESAKSYEEVMRTFFANVLDLPPEQAMKLLWVVGLDLCYAVIASHDAERLNPLFRGMDEPPNL